MKCVERKDEEKVVQGKDKTRCSLEKKDDDGGKNKCKERNLNMEQVKKRKIVERGKMKRRWRRKRKVQV